MNQRFSEHRNLSQKIRQNLLHNVKDDKDKKHDDRYNFEFNHRFWVSEEINLFFTSAKASVDDAGLGPATSTM